MTPEQKLIKIVEYAGSDDLERARMAFRGMSEAELNKQHGQSGQTRQQILIMYENEHALYLKAKALLMSLLNGR